jgi:hypothetical protein
VVRKKKAFGRLISITLSHLDYAIKICLSLPNLFQFSSPSTNPKHSLSSSTHTNAFYNNLFLLAFSVVLVTAIPALAPVPNPIPAPDMFADIMAAANAWTEQQRLARLAKDAELAVECSNWALSDH